MYSDNQYQTALDNTASMLSSVEDYMKTRYTIEQNKEMREREDNATQRRVDDLKKAGLSPVLAAGSPASSAQGAQPSGNAIGAYLDAKNAIEQLKQNHAFTTQARIQTDMLKTQQRMLNRAEQMDFMDNLFNLGFTPSNVYLNDGVVSPVYRTDQWGASEDSQGNKIPLSSTPWYRTNHMALDNMQNTTDLLQKQNTWYNAQQWSDLVNDSLGTIFNGASTFGSLKLKNKALNQDFSEFQQELNRKQNYDNWRMSPHGESYVDNRGFRYTRSRY